MDGQPLTPEQQQALEDAEERASTFIGAARVAAFNGWTFGFFAAVSILFGLFNLPGLLVGIGLAVVARNELVGQKGILSYDPGALELLWKNQIGLMILIVVYCLWAMYRSRVSPDPALAELDEVLGPGTGDLFQQITAAAYGVVIAATVVYQGLNARYYHLRIERMKDFLARTPEWVIQVRRSVKR